MRYLVWQTQISRPEIFKHETQISIPEIFYAIHKTQVLRYSTQKTQISRPEIFNVVDADIQKNFSEFRNCSRITIKNWF